MNCTKQSTDRDLEGGRWLHVEVGEVGRQESYRRYDNSRDTWFLTKPYKRPALGSVRTIANA